MIGESTTELEWVQITSLKPGDVISYFHHWAMVTWIFDEGGGSYLIGLLSGAGELVTMHRSRNLHYFRWLFQPAREV